MPALDAAERHISPAENICRFGEDELVEDDAPPMLSPQAHNSENLTSSSNNQQPVNTMKTLITTTSTSLTSTTNDSFNKTFEASHNNSTINEGLQNTSSSSASSGGCVDMIQYNNNISCEQIHDESDSFTQILQKDLV